MMENRVKVMMGIFNKCVQWIMPLAGLIEAEKTLYNRSGSITALQSAPEQFRMTRGPSAKKGSRVAGFRRRIKMLPLMRRLGKDVIFSLQSVDQNPKVPKDTVTEAFLCEFEDYASSLGIGAIGYTHLPREAIFLNKAVLFDRVMMFSMEMDRDKMAAAPSEETMFMIMDTYYKLGRAVNKLVNYLRSHGYAAQGGHPLGGQALYPMIAEKAGMGFHGRHGMLISPKYGPRQRLAAIYCNIMNLPIAQNHEHTWIASFCDQCGKCIRACPAQAIYKTPIMRESATITHIDSDKCFPYFEDHYSCSVCIKECVFNNRAYTDIKKSFLS
jgi:epoxyqueuosine reductase